MWPGMRATVRCIHVVEAWGFGGEWDVNVRTLMQTDPTAKSKGTSPFARAEPFGRDEGVVAGTTLSGKRQWVDGNRRSAWTGKFCAPSAAALLRSVVEIAGLPSAV